jgi:hypothetical protein
VANWHHKKIKWSCAVGGSKLCPFRKRLHTGSCSAANQKTVVKKHRNLRSEGVNGRGRAEENPKENRHMEQLHCRMSKILKKG